MIRRRFRYLGILCCLSVIIVWFLWIKEDVQQQQILENNFQKAFPAMNSRDVETFLLVLIMTGPKNKDRRDAIRKTWLEKVIQDKKFGNKRKDITHYFVLGTKGLEKTLLDSIQQEQSTHNDMLLLEGFEDAYEKLTEKLGLMLIWVRDHIKFQYIFKGDDDTFARIDLIYTELKNRHLTNSKEALYYGYFYGKGRVKKSGPWKETEWKLCDLYIPYARGGGYILSSNIVEYIANNFNFFKRYLSEDVSLGSWLAPLNIQRIHDKRFDTEYKTRGCSNTFIVSHKQSIDDMLSKHASLKSTGNLCTNEFSNFAGYEYNWDVPPSQCCVRTKGIP